MKMQNNEDWSELLLEDVLVIYDTEERKAQGVTPIVGYAIINANWIRRSMNENKLMLVMENCKNVLELEFLYILNK